jgi:hypothetical protein
MQKYIRWHNSDRGETICPVNFFNLCVFRRRATNILHSDLVHFLNMSTNIASEIPTIPSMKAESPTDLEEDAKKLSHGVASMQTPPFVRPISSARFVCAIIAQSSIGVLFGMSHCSFISSIVADTLIQALTTPLLQMYKVPFSTHLAKSPRYRGSALVSPWVVRL